MRLVWDTDTASGLRLVSATFEKTNFMSRSSLGSHAVMPSIQHCMISVFMLLCELLLHPVSQTVTVLASGLLVVFFSPPPVHLLTLAGLIRVAIFMSLESALLNRYPGRIYAIVPLLQHRLQLCLRLDPKEMGLCYTQTSTGSRF